MSDVLSKPDHVSWQPRGSQTEGAEARISLKHEGHQASRRGSDGRAPLSGEETSPAAKLCPNPSALEKGLMRIAG